VPKPLRSDFASASVGLALPAQRKNLGKLHDWLVDEVGIDSRERVVALSNYQQGRFGRLPTHILLVTTHRLAFTHDKGLRSIPLVELDTTRVGIKSGLASAEVTFVLRSGELINFRRGMTLGMQEVAEAIRQGGEHPSNSGAAPTLRDDGPTDPNTSSTTSNYWSGRGDDVIQFQSPAPGLQIFEISGGSSTDAFSVWALSEHLQPQDLLVNTGDRYNGICVSGLQGPVGGLQVNANSSWTITPVDAETLPVLGSGCSGTGDAAVIMSRDLALTDEAQVTRIEAVSAGNFNIWAYGMSPSLLVNTIGAYTGTVIIPQGTQLLAITCEGHWSLSA